MDKEKRRCSKCGLLRTYFRNQGKEKVCQGCGHIETKEELKRWEQ